MRPCDCETYQELDELREQGLAFNQRSIMVRLNHVILENGPGSLKLSKNDFKNFAQWYLTDQDEKENNL